ncbi:MAG: hypothetical protein ACYCUD_10955 [Candidatus Dormibacteria bacterium]
MGRVTMATSRAIYDDAQIAYRDGTHPCHVFADLQPEAGPLDNQEWMLPIPFLGASANQTLVFLGLNPSYLKSDSDPRLGSSFEEWDRWARTYFQTTPRPWAELYERYQRVGESAFGPSFELGRDAIVLECIRFRSAAGQGTTGRESIPAWEHEMRFTKQLIDDIQPSVIVTIGTAPFGAMHGIFPALEPHVTGAFRLRSYEFQAFTTEAASGPLVVIPSRHLTGVWGNPTVPISRLGTAIRNVVSDRQRAG